MKRNFKNNNIILFNMGIFDSLKNFIFSKGAQNNTSNVKKENKKKNEKDECLTNFREKIKETPGGWKEAFNEYVDCKYNMFNKLKEKERKMDDLLQFGIIFSGALIPIVNVIIPLDKMEYWRVIVTTLLGFAITILVGFNQIKKYHERWTTFKGVSRALEFEYINLTKPKNDFSDEHEKNAYDNIINILQQEVKEVVSLFKDKDKGSDNNDQNNRGQLNQKPEDKAKEGLKEQ
jgi:hypothetical protein